MKINKKVILISAIILFVIAASYIIKSAENDDITRNDSDELISLKAELNQLKINYLNVEGENKNLIQRNEELEDSIFELQFELVKATFESGKIIDLLPDPKSTQILYKYISDTEYVLLYKEETRNNLMIASKEQGLIRTLMIDSLNPDNGISWSGGTDPDHYFLGGVITNNDIKHIQVFVNEEVYESNIIQIDNNLSVWFCIFEYKRKSTLEDPDKMKIKAFDKEGTVLWEESFDGDQGG